MEKVAKQAMTHRRCVQTFRRYQLQALDALPVVMANNDNEITVFLLPRSFQTFHLRNRSISIRLLLFKRSNMQRQLNMLMFTKGWKRRLEIVAQRTTSIVCLERCNVAY